MQLPSDDVLRFLVSTYARLRAEHGEAIGDPELVQPNGDYFPDEFTRDAESVARLFRRMLAYAPVSDDLAVRLAFVDPDEHEDAGGCGKSSCGSGGKIGARGGVTELDDGYRVDVMVTDVGNPVVLTTSLARSVGGLVLFEAGEELPRGDEGAVSEIAAAMCGFGVLLCSGAAIYAKACGGLRVHRATHLSVEETSVLLALFAKLHGVRASTARAHLETTQREAFEIAWAWADSNDALMKALADRPESLQDGVFPVEPPKGLLTRLFSRKKQDDEPLVVAPRERRTRSEEELRRLAEAKALVEEALRDSR